MQQRDWLLEQLPRVMQEDRFIRDFVGITQEIADSLRDEIEKIDYFLDPTIAPEDFVRWIGGWLGLAVEPVIADPVEREARVRRVVQTGGQLFLRRGTRAGLEGMLTALTGEPAHVSDSGGVFRTGQASGNLKRVVVRLRNNGGNDDQSLLQLVHQEIPVDVTFDLLIAGRRVAEEAPPPLGRLEDVLLQDEIERLEERRAELDALNQPGADASLFAGVALDPELAALSDTGAAGAGAAPGDADDAASEGQQ